MNEENEEHRMHISVICCRCKKEIKGSGFMLPADIESAERLRRIEKMRDSALCIDCMKEEGVVAVLFDLALYDVDDHLEQFAHDHEGYIDISSGRVVWD